MAGKRAPSKHSRASRRATSPSIDTDKSLKAVSLPSAPANSSSARRSTALQPSVLAARRSAGVMKKTAKGRKSRPSARAKRRAEKGLEMAEAVLERTSRKVEMSLGRAKNVKARSKGWDDINKTAGLQTSAALGGDGKNEDEEDDAEEDMDDDMEEEEEEEDAATAKVTAVPNRFGGDDEDEDEEIL